MAAEKTPTEQKTGIRYKLQRQFSIFNGSNSKQANNESTVNTTNSITSQLLRQSPPSSPTPRQFAAANSTANNAPQPLIRSESQSFIRAMSPNATQGHRRLKQRKLDILFIQDTTESQKHYINLSISRCKTICNYLKGLPPGQLDTDGLRVGVLAFRDYGDEYITKNFGGFTSKVDEAVTNLSSLSAQGGGGPEAVGAALNAALKLDWRAEAVKIAILITDAPPHGIGEEGDTHANGDSEGKDPLHSVRAMSRRGIGLMVIACEPTLSCDYKFGHDFYMALVKLTNGIMLPLSDSHILGPLIARFAIERRDFSEIVKEFTEIQAKRRSHNLRVGTIPEATEEVKIWMDAKSTREGRDMIRREKQTNGSSRSSPGGPPSVSSSSKSSATVMIKNTTDSILELSYSENGILSFITIQPDDKKVLEKPFRLNRSYSFEISRGTTVVRISRIFTKDEEWNLSFYFT